MTKPVDPKAPAAQRAAEVREQAAVKQALYGTPPTTEGTVERTTETVERTTEKTEVKPNE